jgi:hypothetical protein
VAPARPSMWQCPSRTWQVGGDRARGWAGQPPPWRAKMSCGSAMTMPESAERGGTAVSAGRPQGELGKWLRAQRQQRSWNVPEMTRRLRRAATAAEDRLPSNECLFTMIRRWERGDIGVSERYMLYYCRAFEIDVEQFGPPASPGSGHPGGDVAQPDAASTAAGPAGEAQFRCAGGEGDQVSGQHLASLLRDIRDGLREDAKLHQARAEQMGASAASAALCRGQALAYAVAAEQIDAALASSSDRVRQP